MLTALRAALVTKFGTIGEVSQFNSDFEASFIEAVHEVFPEVVVKGCSFHYRQAVMRHLQQGGLKLSYITDPNIKTWVRRIMSLSLLSTAAVP